MGNTTSALMKIVQMRALTDAASEQMANNAVHEAFKWDPNDCSPNLTISDDGQLVTRTNSRGTFDVVKTKAAFVGGVHVWEIHWSQSDYGHHARIGITAENDLPLNTRDASQTLGMTSTSCAWDLSTGQLLHDSKIMQNFPNRAGDVIPSVINVVINVEEKPASLGFYRDDQSLIVKFEGLSLQKQFLYPAISTSHSGARVRINYIGGSESILGFSQGILPLMCFHEKHGGSITLSKDFHSASRSNSGSGSSLVISNRPLAPNELFELCVECKNSSHSDTLIFGVTTNKPEHLFRLNKLQLCKEGELCLFEKNEISIITKGVRRSKQVINGDLQDLETGHTVGVRYTGDSHLMFYINNVCQVSFRYEKSCQPLYVVTEVGQRIVFLKINDPDYLAIADESASEETDALRILTNAMDAVEMMREKNPAQLTQVHEKVKGYLYETFRKLQCHRHISLLASVLVEAGAAELMTRYLAFLENCNMANRNVWLCYETITTVCLNFANESVALCIALANAGLVKMCVQTVVSIRASYKEKETKVKKLKMALSILHNCAKVPENRVYYHRYDVIKHVSGYVDTDLHSTDIAMSALFIMSHIYVNSEINQLIISNSLLNYILMEYRKAMENNSVHRSKGYFVNEFTIALGNLAANERNCKLLVNSGGMDHFLRLLNVGDSSEKEHALNAISDYIIPATQDVVAQTPGLKDRLEELKDCDDEALCQAADRCLLKLQQSDFLRKSVKVEFQAECEYWEQCQRYRTSLGLPDYLFNPSYDMCFCSMCHAKRGDQPHYMRGRPTKRYSMPVGWCRFALAVPGKAKSLDVYNKWHRAFYGTNATDVGKILKDGKISNTAGDCGKMLICSSHLTADARSRGFSVSQILLSPSIRYAGCDAHAKPEIYLDETGEEYNGHVVLQVFVRPSSYRVGPQTLGARRQLDPSFSNQELLWATYDPNDIILYGLLVKLDEAGYYRQALRD